ncbi:MAG TPA: PaaI family thioesterase [Telluria sp.]
MNTKQKLSPEDFKRRGEGFLPGYLGIEIVSVEPGRVVAQLPIKSHLLAPNGYLHAGSVITLADTAAGYGCIASLPDGAASFTTIETKSNHLGTAREGVIECVAALTHGGRTTQVWDVVVSDQANGKTIALFRCTQMVLYPK